MKGISILTGALFALGLASSPAAMANDDLNDVTADFVFDDVEDGELISLEVERDRANEDREDGESNNEDDGRQSGDGPNFEEEARVADLRENDMDGEEDEAGEGELEDDPVEEIEDGNDGEEGLDGGDELGEDVAESSDVMDEMGNDDVAAESDVESIEDIVEDDIPAEDGDLA